MPIKLDPHKSIRFQQGRKYGLEEGLERGLKKGRQQTSMEKDMTFVTNLLHSTDFSADKIARLAGVTVSFVEKIKSKLA